MGPDFSSVFPDTPTDLPTPVSGNIMHFCRRIAIDVKLIRLSN